MLCKAKLFEKSVHCKVQLEFKEGWVRYNLEGVPYMDNYSG